MAGYSGTPLARKLGLKDGQLVLLADAPAGWTLPEPVPDVRLHRRLAGSGYDAIVVFCPDGAALQPLATRRPPQVADLLLATDDRVPVGTILQPAGMLWVAWPKKASGVPTDLTENGVRDHGLACGLVDVKVCAIDDVWSGLKFVRRLADR